MRRAPKYVPADPSERLAQEADALAERMGGAAALIDYLSGRLTPSDPCGGASLEDDEHDQAYAAAKRWHITLRLEGEELRRLDQHCAAIGLTRNRWAAALIRKALSGKAPFSQLERMNAGGMVKELKRIEGNTAKLVRELAGLEAAVRGLLGRQREIEQFGAQVRGLAQTLDETFRGAEAYWNEMIEGDTDAPAGGPGTEVAVVDKTPQDGPTPSNVTVYRRPTSR